MHRLGYVHLDLKPDNIFIEATDLYEEASSKLVLIDFGISQMFLDEVGSHVPMRNDVDFSGNIYYSSKHAFMYQTQSRRDDFISLAYLLAFLLNGHITWLPHKDKRDPK